MMWQHTNTPASRVSPLKTGQRNKLERHRSTLLMPRWSLCCNFSFQGWNHGPVSEHHCTLHTQVACRGAPQWLTTTRHGLLSQLMQLSAPPSSVGPATSSSLSVTGSQSERPCLVCQALGFPCSATPPFPLPLSLSVILSVFLSGSLCVSVCL